jgi:hypothetical protein
MIPKELASRMIATIATMIPTMYGNTFMSPPEWGNRMCSYTRDDIRDDRLEQVV